MATPTSTVAQATTARCLATVAATVAPTAAAAAAESASAPKGRRQVKFPNHTYAYPAKGARDAALNWKAVGEPVCEIQVNGYVLHQVNFFSKFIQRAAHHMEMPIRGPVALEPHVRRWTVLTSPFKYKKFQETFERKTYKRLVTVYASSNDAVDKFMHYLVQVAPAGVGLRVIRYERETPGVADRMKAAAESILADGGKVQLPRTVYSPKVDFYEMLSEGAKGYALKQKLAGEAAASAAAAKLEAAAPAEGDAASEAAPAEPKAAEAAAAAPAESSPSAAAAPAAN
ncbi:28S ribosomal protein S10, mitochondrial [Blastocladiella emersonii ATCC 22665]|nr:28S ribosomal protein S10, mitochondrial [Blastocladiella emersonii ATCC 22665]